MDEKDISLTEDKKNEEPENKPKDKSVSIDSGSLISYVGNLKEKRKVFLWTFLIVLAIILMFIYISLLCNTDSKYLYEKKSAKISELYSNDLTLSKIDYSKLDTISITNDEYSVNYTLDEKKHVINNKIMFDLSRGSISSLISYKSYLYLDGKKLISDEYSFDGVLSNEFYQEVVETESDINKMISTNLSSMYSLSAYTYESSGNYEVIVYYPFKSNDDKSAKLFIINSNNEIIYYKVLNSSKFTVNNEEYGLDGFINIDEGFLFYINEDNEEVKLNIVNDEVEFITVDEDSENEVTTTTEVIQENSIL